MHPAIGCCMCPYISLLLLSWSAGSFILLLYRMLFPQSLDLPQYPSNYNNEDILYFIQVSDLHLSAYVPPDHTELLFNRMTKEVLGVIKPWAVVATGDLTNGWPIERPEEWSLYRRLLGRNQLLDPIYWCDMPGNHDMRGQDGAGDPYSAWETTGLSSRRMYDERRLDRVFLPTSEDMSTTCDTRTTHLSTLERSMGLLSWIGGDAEPEDPRLRGVYPLVMDNTISRVAVMGLEVVDDEPGLQGFQGDFGAMPAWRVRHAECMNQLMRDKYTTNMTILASHIPLALNAAAPSILGMGGSSAVPGSAVHLSGHLHHYGLSTRLWGPRGGAGGVDLMCPSLGYMGGARVVLVDNGVISHTDIRLQTTTDAEPDYRDWESTPADPLPCIVISHPPHAALSNAAPNPSVPLRLTVFSPYPPITVVLTDTTGKRPLVELQTRGGNPSEDTNAGAYHYSGPLFSQLSSYSSDNTLYVQAIFDKGIITHYNMSQVLPAPEGVLPITATGGDIKGALLGFCIPLWLHQGVLLPGSALLVFEMVLTIVLRCRHRVTQKGGDAPSVKDSINKSAAYMRLSLTADPSHSPYDNRPKPRPDWAYTHRSVPTWFYIWAFLLISGLLPVFLTSVSGRWYGLSATAIWWRWGIRGSTSAMIITGIPVTWAVFCTLSALLSRALQSAPLSVSSWAWTLLGYLGCAVSWIVFLWRGYMPSLWLSPIGPLYWCAFSVWLGWRRS
eukprot:gnl/Dysnectes_brevis/616_a681_1250.p1 GENE.gnl/Dysnectes_brevis/616_a681_1250~~gnl/Dysnectes_brevis/616_a681_1250.p1  ORF type:complete len:726 (+),score=167.85 gnl/Dysnectes_brevis/616_a681_1250:645-2822(+)